MQKTPSKQKNQKKLLENNFEKSLTKCCQSEADTCPAAKRVDFHSVFLFAVMELGLLPSLFCVSGVFLEAFLSSLPPIPRGSVCHRLTYIRYKFSVTSFKYFFFI